MKGKHLKRTEKGAMARYLVYYCITILTATAIWAVAITTVAAYEGWTIDLNAVLTFIGASFGGELLLLVFKRVFAKPTDEARNEETNETEVEG